MLRNKGRVRCGSHACGHQFRNSWRMAAARVWSYPIPYAIGARIASDYAGRPVLPPSQTVCGFAQGQGRVRQWPRRRPLPAVLEPVGSQRAIDSNSSWRLAMSRSAARTSAGSQRDVDTGQVESGGAPPRWLLSAPRPRAASVESLSRTHRSWMSTASNGGPVTKSPPARAPRAADPAPPRGIA